MHQHNNIWEGFDMAIVVAQGGGVVNIAEVWRVNFYLWVDGQIGITGINTFINMVTGAPVNAGDLAFAYMAATDPNFTLLTANAVLILGARASRVKGAGPDPQAGIATSTSTGSSANPPMPQQASGIMSYYTIFAGRSKRGRMYIPFPSVGDQDTDASPIQNYADRITALGDNIMGVTAFTGISTGSANINWVIWHKATLTTDDVASHIGRKRWATQKRRGNYGKLNPPIIPG
jgi:hypothetical protein